MKKVFYFLFPFSYKIKWEIRKEWDYVFTKKDLFYFVWAWFMNGVCFVLLLMVLEELLSK